jgi:hypothetical protein
MFLLGRQFNEIHVRVGARRWPFYWLDDGMPDAVPGPTFANIFAYHFLNLRRTDRQFYNFNQHNSIDQVELNAKSNGLLILFVISWNYLFKILFYVLVFDQVNWENFKKSLWL